MADQPRKRFWRYVIRAVMIVALLLVGCVVFLSWVTYQQILRHDRLGHLDDCSLLLKSDANDLWKKEPGWISLTSSWRLLNNAERERLSLALADRLDGSGESPSDYMRDSFKRDLQLFGYQYKDGYILIGVLSAGRDGRWGTSDDLAWPTGEKDVFRQLVFARQDK
ncbi:MAG: hypothetical protein IT443_00145 [Phycisphaeraceae bacterium]|nr:hypothetical protein [Phycisphaeraceae bacterium]